MINIWSVEMKWQNRALAGVDESEKTKEMVYRDKIGRKEAISRGMNIYTGKKCSCGSCYRYVSGGNCIHCSKKVKQEKIRSEMINMDKVKARRKIEEIKESNDDYWDSLLED